MKSAKNVTAFPGPRSERRKDELAFLPAALEIVETPPSPVGRAVAFTIIAVFIAAVAWAAVGTVDIVAVAQGKIIPSGRTKTIQPFETGVVRTIHVRDGQSVRAGDALVELDPTMTGAELGHLKGDLSSAQMDVARLRAALAAKDDPLPEFKPPQDIPPDLIQMHRRFLVSQTAEQKAKLTAIDGQMAQKEAERATIKASIEKLKAIILPLEERVEIRKHLASKELGSKLIYLTDLQELLGQRQEVLVQQSRYNEAEAAIAALADTRSKTVAEYERALFDDLVKAEQKAAGLRQDIIKAEQRTSLQKLTAPVEGVVQQLAIHTIGGVVTPAQALMVIVPAESRLEIEAMISNRDIGFIEVGQDAAIKVDTFNFTRYGLLQGKVLTVSNDAISRDKPQDKSTDKPQGAEASSSEPKGQELLYAARVSLDRTRMQVEDKTINLSPGMAVTVEIKTGARNLISYLLSPLVRYKQESLRER
jgi:hemolysin D